MRTRTLNANDADVWRRTGEWLRAHQDPETRPRSTRLRLRKGNQVPMTLTIRGHDPLEVRLDETLAPACTFTMHEAANGNVNAIVRRAQATLDAC